MERHSLQHAWYRSSGHQQDVPARRPAAIGSLSRGRLLSIGEQGGQSRRHPHGPYLISAVRTFASWAASKSSQVNTSSGATRPTPRPRTLRCGGGAAGASSRTRRRWSPRVETHAGHRVGGEADRRVWSHRDVVGLGVLIGIMLLVAPEHPRLPHESLHLAGAPRGAGAVMASTANSRRCLIKRLSHKRAFTRRRARPTRPDTPQAGSNCHAHWR